MNAPTKTNRNAADKNDKVSLPDSNSYMRQTILNLYKSGIAIDVISSQTGISQEEVNKIIQDAEQQRQQQGQISYPSLLQSFSPNSQVDLKYVIRMAQTRVWRALEGEPEFVISFVETQDILEKFGKSKVSLVILNIDLVSSTRLSMTLPLDRLTMIIQAFNQEMSMIIKAFNGYVLKYVGDAVLAFFIVPRNQSGAKVACINAIDCARCMIEVAQQAINPILNQYDYPEMNVRIGIDFGENAIIQSGWDVHPDISTAGKDNYNNNNNIRGKKENRIKKPIYDILSYTMSIAVKMTAHANPNHIVIGQLVFDILDGRQKSAFQLVDIPPEIWSYVSSNTGGSIYNIYTNTTI